MKTRFFSKRGGVVSRRCNHSKRKKRSYYRNCNIPQTLHLKHNIQYTVMIRIPSHILVFTLLVGGTTVAAFAYSRAYGKTDDEKRMMLVSSPAKSQDASITFVLILYTIRRTIATVAATEKNRRNGCRHFLTT